MVFSHLGVGVLREPGLYTANTNMNYRFCFFPGVHVNNPLQKKYHQVDSRAAAARACRNLCKHVVFSMVWKCVIKK